MERRKRILCDHWRNCEIGDSRERKCQICNVWLCINCMPICSCGISTSVVDMHNKTIIEANNLLINYFPKDVVQYILTFITEPKEDIMRIEYPYDDPCTCFKDPRPECFAVKCFATHNYPDYEWICECTAYKCLTCDNNVCDDQIKCRICSSLICSECNKQFIDYLGYECCKCQKCLCENCVNWKNDDNDDKLSHCSNCNYSFIN